MPEPWKAAPAMARIAVPGGVPEARVVARPLEYVGLATVLARKGQAAALAAKVKKTYGVELPDGPRMAAGKDIAFVGAGPGAWMAVAESAGHGWAAGLTRELEGLVSISDQSDGYAGVRLEGPAVLAALAKGVFLDLHQASFPVGAAAGVSVNHIGVVMWRRGPERFDLMCFRSFAGSFWHWIEESAAEFGLRVVEA